MGFSEQRGGKAPNFCMLLCFFVVSSKKKINFDVLSGPFFSWGDRAIDKKNLT